MTALKDHLLANLRWRSDPPVWPEERTHYADYTQWWRQPEILQTIGVPDDGTIGRLVDDALETADSQFDLVEVRLLRETE